VSLWSPESQLLSDIVEEENFLGALV